MSTTISEITSKLLPFPLFCKMKKKEEKRRDG
jgi:hypothetical protein